MSPNTSPKMSLKVSPLNPPPLPPPRALAAPTPCARRGVCGGGARVASLGGMGALRVAVCGLRQSLALLLDDVAVIAFERGAQIRHRRFHLGALARFHLVAEPLQ